MSKRREDPAVSEQRKADHIDLAFKSRVDKARVDPRFHYEPMLSAHPDPQAKLETQFAGYTLNYPLWVSSMTGGTELARKINSNLARMCGEFGFGMGLGSCRSLLDSDARMADFDIRDIIGADVPFFANLGIAQLEQLVEDGALDKVSVLVDKLRADGLIIHVNPLQEWAQEEGDHIKAAPIDTIKALLDVYNGQVIVKEVGQGMGPASLKQLLALPIEAVELAAVGGTNFTRLELMRQEPENGTNRAGMALVGHSALEMVDFINETVRGSGADVKCRSIIISGGLKDFLDGYYLMNKLALPSIYGHASQFLKHAMGDYEDLKRFAQEQIDGLKMAHAFLVVK